MEDKKMFVIALASSVVCGLIFTPIGGVVCFVCFYIGFSE